MIYVFLADGFEELEAIAPIDLLRRAQLPVCVVGVTGQTVRGSHGMIFGTDSQGQGLTFEDVEAVVLPGGLPGATNLDESPLVARCLAAAKEKGAFVSAICAAPLVLGHKGFLQGKRATCFPGFEGELLGAQYTGAPVERDGQVLTARGAGVAVDFALALVEALKDSKTAKTLRESIQCV